MSNVRKRLFEVVDKNKKASLEQLLSLFSFHTKQLTLLLPVIKSIAFISISSCKKVGCRFDHNTVL